jgi:virulence-associated protein VagC
MSQKIVIRKVFQLGASRVITLPRKWTDAMSYVVVEKRNGEIIIRPVEV